MQFRASGYLCQCKEVSGVSLYLPLSALSSFFIPLVQMGESNFLSRLLAPSPPPPFPRSPPLSPPPTNDRDGGIVGINTRPLPTKKKHLPFIFVLSVSPVLHFTSRSTPRTHTHVTLFPFPSLPFLLFFPVMY